MTSQERRDLLTTLVFQPDVQKLESYCTFLCSSVLLFVKHIKTCHMQMGVIKVKLTNVRFKCEYVIMSESENPWLKIHWIWDDFLPLADEIYVKVICLWMWRFSGKHLKNSNLSISWLACTCLILSRWSLSYLVKVKVHVGSPEHKSIGEDLVNIQSLKVILMGLM